jgi:hypothetical protein
MFSGMDCIKNKNFWEFEYVNGYPTAPFIKPDIKLASKSGQ